MTRRRTLPGIYIALLLVLMYLPISIVIIYSFNGSRISSVWGGFTMDWYGALFKDRSMLEALRNSVVLGISSSLLAAVIGTAAAVGVVMRKPPFAKTMEYLSTLPIMMPEIILGMVFLAFFTLLRLPAGMLTLIIAHTSFCTPYVYLLVKARMSGMSRHFAEAARDLGASGPRAFFDVTLPMLLPSIASGMLLAFAMSFDDVIVSAFVTGASVTTLPIKIYSQVKFGVTPKTNALCALLFGVTVLLGVASALLARPRRGRAKQLTIDN